MARLHNRVVMGYFPTPQTIIELISRWLEPAGEETWRLLDPCCGKGEAARLADLVGGDCQTWGVELSPKRAEEAARVMDVVHNAGWRQTRVDDGSVSLLWLNPPYDHDLDGDDRRLEIEFLRTGVSTLVDGGILVYVVPQHLLGYRDAALRLAGHLDDLVVRRFPDGEYERFRQVVVLGRKKPYRTPRAERVEEIRALASGEIAPLGEPRGPWPVTIPPAPDGARFRRVHVSQREQIARAYAAGWPGELLDGMRFREQAVFQPAITPKKGHVAMLMASGLLGTMRLNKNGADLLVKGRVFKKKHTRVEEDEQGEQVTVHTYRPETTVGVVGGTEGVRVIQDTEGLTAFMGEYGDEIAELILQNEPLYDLKPSAAEWDKLTHLGTERLPLPGQTRAGLLDVQKHAAICLARVMRERRAALVQGEMGAGKTTIALATVDLMGAYPAIVVCPPHLVNKWRREAEDVIPGVQTRELSRIGKTASMAHEVNDVRAFVEDWNAGLLGDKAIAVVSSTSNKLAGGWKGALATRYTLPLPKNRSGPFRDALAEYEKARARAPQSEETKALRRAALEAAVNYPVCPDCGQPQTEGRKGERLPIHDRKRFDRKPHVCTECGGVLYEFGARHRRWAIADYVFTQASGFFQMLVADEVHTFKGRSDRGVAFARLVASTRYQLGLTGTLYGGKASDLYLLPFRLGIGGVQAEFDYDSARRWIDLYGVWEERRRKDKQGDDEYSVYNATRRGQVRGSEKPGVSPAILHRIVEHALFLSLKDLGVGLPPYKEEVAQVEMTERQRGQYDRMCAHLKARAREDSRYLSTWLQWSLGRPNSGFRDEQIVKLHREHGEVVERERLRDLPAVVDEGELLPKERWLSEYCKAEVEAGRKVLVYVRQTGTRDIQPRLKQVLATAGIRVGVLNSNVDTRKRERWIARHEPGLDVLIVNPRLVETGLDLVQFATIVFYEIEYSLFTMWQAMRRVWRLGQQKAVKVVFSAYAGTLEADALALMGKKMQAAQLLYGDEVGGAIVPEDDGDFLSQLARSVLEGKELPDLQAMFAEAHPSTTAPTGSPTAQSPRLRMVEMRSLWKQESRRQRQRRRRVEVPAAQMSLF
jgi:hypothetical protein